MGYSGAGSVTRIRDAVSTSRDDAEFMQNLAYVVNSANDNIAGLTSEPRNRTRVPGG